MTSVARSIAGLCLVLGIVLGPSLALAQLPSDLMRLMGYPTSQSSQTNVHGIQRDLAWIGILDGRVTGSMDRPTTEAIRRFQAGVDGPKSGTMSSEQRSVLAQRARAAQRGYGFSRRTIDWLGVRAELPTATLLRPEVSGSKAQTVYFDTHHGSGLRIRFSTFPGLGGTSARQLSQIKSGLEDDAKEQEVGVRFVSEGSVPDGFFISYLFDGWRFTLIAQKSGQDWRTLRVSYRPDAATAMQPVVERIVRGMVLFHGPGLSATERLARMRRGQTPGVEDLPDWFNSMIGNGSGSIVSSRGHVLTNHHVVAGCRRVTVNGAVADVLAADARLDLALVVSPTFANRRYVRFRPANPKLGEAISVMGYPIFNTSQSMNYTRGYVSSIVGYKGDRTKVQVTAPVQPGNSGGPVLDALGRQIAVVASKASSRLQVARNIENVAWVIRGRQALEFLQRNGLDPIVEDRPAGDQDPSVEDVAEWRQFTVRIECHNS